MKTATIPTDTKTSFSEITKQLYKASAKEVTFVNVPAMNYLMIDGHGDPNTSQSYKDAAAQLMHFGPYSAEGPTIQRLHDWIYTHSYRFDGGEQKHHEIYFGDPHRSAPENLKTILRQPFIKA